MQNTLITNDRLESIIRYAKETSNLNGLFAECGVYKGGSIKLLAEHFPHKKIIGFDTFEGSPEEDWSSNEYHRPKDFHDTSLESVKKFVLNCPNIELVKGYFPKSTKNFENEKFAFVHVDFDFYKGCKNALDWFWPRLVEGGIIILDDYEWPHCPGVKQALYEFESSIPFRTALYQAAIKKENNLMQNILINGACPLIGDFLGLSPAIIKLSKIYNVFIDNPNDDILNVLPNNVHKFKEGTTIHKQYDIRMLEAAAKANYNDWYMTQAFLDSLGLPVPAIPPKASLIFPDAKTKSYDILISPFSRALPPDQKWQREKWQELVNKLPDKKFALLGNSKFDDKNYITANNIDIVFDSPFPELCSLFKNSGVLISVITGTSHLAFHLGVKNILLSSQNGAWGKQPDAFCVQKSIHTIEVDLVLAFLFFVRPFYDFDEEYYLSKHPDIRNTGKKGFHHFWEIGSKNMDELRKIDKLEINHRWIKSKNSPY